MSSETPGYRLINLRSPAPAAPACGNGPLGPYREMIALAWPQALMMLAQYCVALADVVVTGHIGTQAQAALGLISVSVFCFLVTAMALANAALAIISQSLGAGLARRSRRYAGFFLLLAMGVGLAFTLTFSQASAVFLRLLRIPDELLPMTESFLGVYLYALPAYYLLLITNAIFQAHGLVRVPLCSMCLVAALNAVLDFGLGLGLWGFPALGCRGVAWATFGSVAAGALLNLSRLHFRGLLHAAEYPPVRWMRRSWRHVFRYAWPAGASQLAWQGSSLALCVILGSLPGDPVGPLAGFAAGVRVEALLTMPAYALGLAAAILVGRALGSGDPCLSRAIALRFLSLGVAALTLAAVALWHLRQPLAFLVAQNPVSQANMLQYLNYSLAVSPFTVGAIILSGVLSGAGANRYSLACFVVAGWLVRLPLAWLLSQAGGLGARGVWFALCVSQVFHCLSLLFVVYARNWQGFAMSPARRSPYRLSRADRLA